MHQQVLNGTHELQNGSELQNKCFCKNARAIFKYSKVTRKHHMNKIRRTLCYIERNCYWLCIESSGCKGSVTYGLRRDFSFPHWLSVRSGPKSNQEAKISRSIVGYDALVWRSERLFSWYSGCAWEKNRGKRSIEYQALLIAFTRASFLHYLHAQVTWNWNSKASFAKSSFKISNLVFREKEEPSYRKLMTKLICRRCHHTSILSPRG